MSTFINPVLRGFHPDPSVCRVGNEYFLVTSSFAYFPALPVYRSPDLVSWELVGHVVDDAAVLDLVGVETSFGVWAPTIRHHRGTFYVVYSVARGLDDMETFVATSQSAVGPWDTPTRLDADGFDPSLFFDDDGRAWFTACRDSSDRSISPGEIWQQEFDPDRLQLVGPRTSIWRGALAGAWVEAPHIVKRGSTYTLIAAEGGTERNHSVTAANSHSINGPYITDARSPLLTHRHLGATEPIQNVGHADLVDTPAGNTFAVVLGVRAPGGYHVTGRETFLVPVDWEDEKPVFAPGVGRVSVHEKRPYIASTHGKGGRPEWMSLRGHVAARHIDERTIELRPGANALSALEIPAMIAIRQTEPSFQFAARPTDIGDTTAGLVAYQGENRYVAIESRYRHGETTVAVSYRSEGQLVELTREHIDDQMSLFISSDGQEYRFGTIDHSGQARVISTIPAPTLSTEDAGGFVGTVLGLTAFGTSSSPPVRFEQVEYSAGTARLSPLSVSASG